MFSDQNFHKAMIFMALGIVALLVVLATVRGGAMPDTPLVILLMAGGTLSFGWGLGVVVFPPIKKSFFWGWKLIKTLRRIKR